MYSLYLFFVRPVPLIQCVHPLSELLIFHFSLCLISVSLIKINQQVGHVNAGDLLASAHNLPFSGTPQQVT